MTEEMAVKLIHIILTNGIIESTENCSSFILYFAKLAVYLQKKEMNWFEILPDQCPPNDAEHCSGTYYRIANGNPAISDDFFSQRKLQPNKIFVGNGITECITRSISLFSNKSEIEKKLKLPKFRHANIAEVCLYPKDGMIKKTFGNAHFSWWRTNEFDVSQAKIIRHE